MIPPGLVSALHACADGIYPLEAGVGLLVANGTFLHRDDFTSRFILHGTSGSTRTAAVDWEAAATALARGELTCSRGEQRILLLAASLADGIPVDLRDTVTGIDQLNTRHLIAAIRHTSGSPEPPARAPLGSSHQSSNTHRAEYLARR
jgi:hypothetical protein